MANITGLVRRDRSSTIASRGLGPEEKSSDVVRLIEQLNDNTAAEALLAACYELRARVAADADAKDTFRRAGGFQQILHLFKCDLGLDSRLETFSAATLLIVSLLDDHRGNVRYFANRLHGWTHVDEACQTIHQALKADGVNVDRRLITLYKTLTTALLGEECHNIVKESDTIRHAGPGIVLVKLAVSCQADQDDSRTILPFIVNLGKLTTTRQSNQVALWDAGVVTHLLALRRNKSELGDACNVVFSNIAYLGLPDLDEVAKLFSAARIDASARDLLLQLMQVSKQPAYVQFDLRHHGHSSLELPSLPRNFPPTTGYTFSIWLRFDGLDTESHTTIFGAFDASQSCFVLLYLEKDTRQLILQTSVRSARPSVRFRSTTFETGRWYHVAIVHRRATQDARSSPASLFVDGEFAEQVKCAYPEAPLQRDDKTPVVRQYPVQSFLGTPRDLALRLGRDQVGTSWSFATAHLFQAPLSDEFIAVQRQLGPRYAGNFQDCLGPLLTYRASAELNRYNELLHPDKSERSDIVEATEHRGSDVINEQKILFSFSAEHVYFLDGRLSDKRILRRDLERRAHQRYDQLSQKAPAIALNAAVAPISEAIYRPYGTAVLAGDPVVALSKALDDASWCLAGSIPLLYKLLEAATTKQAFLQAVRIFFECVKDSWRISEAVEKGNGFGLMSVVIRQKLGLDTAASHAATQLPVEDRESMPFELLSLILDFVGYDSAATERSMIVNPMAYRVLLIDFDTWRHCDARTVELYYVQFGHFVSRNQHHAFNHKRLMRMRVLKKLIDAMKTEDIQADSAQHLLVAIQTLLDTSANTTSYKELAMFVVFGLQDERALVSKPIRGMASAVKLRQHVGAVAAKARAKSNPLPAPAKNLKRSDLALYVLQLLADVLCDAGQQQSIRRFVRSVPARWVSHLLAESDLRVVILTVRIAAHALAMLGAEFKQPFVDRNGGLIAMKSKLKASWRSTDLWSLLFCMLFGQSPDRLAPGEDFNVVQLINSIGIDNDLRVVNPDVLPVLMALLEAGLHQVVEQSIPASSDAHILNTVLRFLAEVYSNSQAFRDFAFSSRYAQDLLFVLFPVVVGSDRVSADTELQADKNGLSFQGAEVIMRPHSNSVGERPPSVRSLTMEKPDRIPSPSGRRVAQGPRRLSSFVFVASDGKPSVPSTRFSSTMSPTSKQPVKLNIGNSMVEALLEIVVTLFVDQICERKDFNGIGLFQKAPPGFREHQAYFESYVLVHTLSQLWTHLQFKQELLHETKVLTNLGRFSQHLAEAVFEGWFIDGAQPVIDFIGKLLEHLQRPQIAALKTVRLCSQAVDTMRVVFLRVTLLRLSELDEIAEEPGTVKFLQQMSYWQTILFATENQETLFTRLICFLLYLRLFAESRAVRTAVAQLWRAVLMQKPTEMAMLMSQAVSPEQRKTAAGFLKLVSLDDSDFLEWVDTHRNDLDSIFIDALAKPWADFVTEENRRNEDTAKTRLNKRREKLRQWQVEENAADQFYARYDTSTSHWRANVHAQERLKSQRAHQDHQESINNINNVLNKIERQLSQPCGVYPDEREHKWRLDETEGLNRMRLRTLRDRHAAKDSFLSKRKASMRSAPDSLRINTVLPKLSQDIVSAKPGTPRPYTDSPAEPAEDVDKTGLVNSISESQLLEGGFEIIDDPKEDEDGTVEDKNRKVMTSLQRGDMVQQLYNISRIVGLEACEGLLVIGKKCLYLQDSYFQRSDGEIVSVSQAPEDERDPYLQLISGKDIGSQQTKNSTGDQITRHWTWTEVLSISKRRFLLRDVSLEVFFTDGRSYLLTCMSTKIRDDLYTAVIYRAPHVHGTTTVASEDAWRLDNLRNPEEAPSSIGSRFANVFAGATTYVSTRKWIKGEMSNFQYLMLVNTMAGRSFNDLTQYPVFPWILADYDSEELDLNDPKTFRDLTKPMGCQSPAREAEFRDRYQQFAEMSDQNAPAFNYGTHYSSAMIVSSYLIRLQPFVQSYLLLQGGSFDHADRLFDSVGKAWLSASRDNMSDVRELTPEFFYLPEFLTNVNKYDFGTKQGDGGVVDDVKLPRWAKGDPHIFIAKHREALESPFVSEHLHHWVDLTFGYKQRGEAAIAATNVFQHLSYGGAKDLDLIDDPVERLATIGIIHSFGQTPHQVFQRPHPARDVDRLTSSRLDALVETLVRLPTPLFESDDRVAELCYSQTQERLLCSGSGKINMMPHSDRFMQWRLTDNSVRFISASSKRLVGLYENTHIGVIRRAVFADSKTLITAGLDCTLAIWNINVNREWIELQASSYLFGHRAPISLVATSKVFSTLLSASEDGQVLLWDLNRHSCLRVLAAAGEQQTQAARISSTTGHIALCQGPDVRLYTLNGHLLLRQRVCDTPYEDITCCAFYEGSQNEWLERELLFTGHGNGVVNVWSLVHLSDGTWHLLLVVRLNHTDMSRDDGSNMTATITSILPMSHAVFTGDDSGRVWEWDVLQKQGITTGRLK